MKFAFKCLIIQTLFSAFVIAQSIVVPSGFKDGSLLEETHDWDVTTSDLEFLGPSEKMNQQIISILQGGVQCIADLVVTNQI